MVTIAVVWCDGHLESCGRLHIIKVKVDRCILCVKLLAIMLSIDKYAIMYIINSFIDIVQNNTHHSSRLFLSEKHLNPNKTQLIIKITNPHMKGVYSQKLSEVLSSLVQFW